MNAGTPGADLAPQAGRAAAEAAKYGAARGAYLQQIASAAERKLAWLETPPAPPSAGWKDASAAYAATEGRVARREIDAFANDPDAGIRQLRTALERENAALDALAASIAQHQNAADALNAASAAVAQSHIRAAGDARELLALLKQSTDDADAETGQWAEYYGLLPSPSAPSPVTPNVVAPSPVTPTVATPKTAAAPTPLIRYIGAWTYPTTGGLYHGEQPDFLDLVLHDENGLAQGTLFGRFKLPPGSSLDPVVRFDFSGPFQNTRTQVFHLTARDGSTGTIELIPGGAFNLLEINFQIDAKPGKIRQGNVILVKK